MPVKSQQRLLFQDMGVSMLAGRGSAPELGLLWDQRGGGPALPPMPHWSAPALLAPPLLHTTLGIVPGMVFSCRCLVFVCFCLTHDDRLNCQPGRSHGGLFIQVHRLEKSLGRQGEGWPFILKVLLLLALNWFGAKR